jgi:glycoside/pentoside/hexuronide:cation symporter, GPH family
MLVGALGTRKHALALEDGHQQEARSFGALILIFWQAIRITPNIGRLLIVAFLVLFTNSVINQLSLHLATYFWQLHHSWTPRLPMAGALGSLVAMFLAPAFARALGTRNAMMLGLGAFFLVQALAIILPLVDAAPAAASWAIGAFVVSFRFLGGLAYGLYVVPFNIVTYEIGDEHEANTGLPAQGIVASFMFIGLQLGSGAVALLAGSFLGLIDFPVGVPLAQMPEEKVRALALFILALIVFAGGAMAWLVGTFKLRERT